MNSNSEHTTDPWYDIYFGEDYLKIDVQPNTDHEVAFIVSVLGLKPSTVLLDAPCGYGRHLIPLVNRGVQVIGLDRSAAMLGEASRRLADIGMKAGLVRGDIRDMPFEGVFDCAMNMFNSFGYFADERDNYAALRSYDRVLKPGGRFILDLVNRDFVIRSMARKDWYYHAGTVVLEKKWIDPRLNRSEIDVSIVDKRGKRDYHHSIRLYTLSEITMLLEGAGFGIVEVFGGFSGETYDINSDRMLILAETLTAEVE